MTYITELESEHKDLQDALGAIGPELRKATKAVIDADKAYNFNVDDKLLRNDLTEAKNAKSILIARQKDIAEDMGEVWRKIELYNDDPVKAEAANEHEKIIAAIRQINPALVDPETQTLALIGFVISLVKTNKLQTPYEPEQLDLVLSALSTRIG